MMPMTTMTTNADVVTHTARFKTKRTCQSKTCISDLAALNRHVRPKSDKGLQMALKMNYQDVLDFRAFMRIVNVLDKMDVFGILDMLGEPPIAVIEGELDKAVNCYRINRNAYPTYVV